MQGEFYLPSDCVGDSLSPLRLAPNKSNSTLEGMLYLKFNSSSAVKLRKTPKSTHPIYDVVTRENEHIGYFLEGRISVLQKSIESVGGISVISSSPDCMSMCDVTTDELDFNLLNLRWGVAFIEHKDNFMFMVQNPNVPMMLDIGNLYEI